MQLPDSALSFLMSAPRLDSADSERKRRILRSKGIPTNFAEFKAITDKKSKERHGQYSFANVSKLVKPNYRTIRPKVWTNNDNYYTELEK